MHQCKNRNITTLLQNKIALSLDSMTDEQKLRTLLMPASFAAPIQTKDLAQNIINIVKLP